MKVEAIMTRDVVSIEPSTTVSDALDLIEEQSIRHLVVLDGDKLAGLVSDRDLVGHILPLQVALAHPAEAKTLLETPVSELLRSEIVTVAASDDVAKAVDAMLVFGIGAVPVVDGEGLLGIVSTVDVLQAARDVL